MDLVLYRGMESEIEFHSAFGKKIDGLRKSVQELIVNEVKLLARPGRA